MFTINIAHKGISPADVGDGHVDEYIYKFKSNGHIQIP